MTDLLGQAMATDEAADWLAYSQFLRERFDPDRRMALSLAALKSCEEDDLSEILAILAPRAEPGDAPFMESVKQRADGWAALAPQDELKIYIAAAVDRMGDASVDRMISWLQGRMKEQAA